MAKREEWDHVDWSKKNVDIAREMGVSASRVMQVRSMKSLGRTRKRPVRVIPANLTGRAAAARAICDEAGMVGAVVYPVEDDPSANRRGARSGKPTPIPVGCVVVVHSFAGRLFVDESMYVIHTQPWNKGPRHPLLSVMQAQYARIIMFIGGRR